MLEQPLVPFSDIIFGDQTGAKNVEKRRVFIESNGHDELDEVRNRRNE
jgi:type II secretory pathway component PulC